MAKHDNIHRAITPLVSVSADDVSLHCAKKMPHANGYLYNKDMLLQLNCRGFAISQFMQPEPAKYSHGPSLEAKTFIQPEHHYYAHHPGRFFYVKDLDTQEVFSLPHEPMRKTLDSFKFSQRNNEICWHIIHQEVSFEITAQLVNDAVVECWQIHVVNQSKVNKNLALYPYFTIGYQSWMNQQADFCPQLNAIVAKSITPYQKVEQYYEHQSLQDTTFLWSQGKADAWLANQQLFEGEGGLTLPDAIVQSELPNQGTQYQVACGCLQYNLALAPNERFQNTWLFGPAKDENAIKEISANFLSTIDSNGKEEFSSTSVSLSGDDRLFHYINHWLPRQINMHGVTNRLTTDPQTRNYLQDNMGMSFLAPLRAKQAFLTAISQQHITGEMPDGILLNPDAELKYINQVPHSDHSAWLAICLLCYLDETNDVDILHHRCGYLDSEQQDSVLTHLEKAIDYLLLQRDERGLCYISQGDWCDPMNMVGHLGKGVSSWLSLACAYSIDCFVTIVKNYVSSTQQNSCQANVLRFTQAKEALNHAVNQHCWDGDWYARGINDHGRVFGTKADEEGRIYLNPQSWALLSQAVSPAKQYSMLNAVQSQLLTPYGVMMLSPSYTAMDEGIGRITQKSPGVAENGSVYNHASVFYAYALYQIGEYDMAFSVLSKMLPSEADQLIRGQLPSFIPNYYRGAYHQFPDYAGKSSHLFNTGTVAWVYRCVVEELCGLKGNKEGLLIQPKLPRSLPTLTGTRNFRGATIEFSYQQIEIDETKIWLNEQQLKHPRIDSIEAGKTYQLRVDLPRRPSE
ncbi:GH36-type glycosyl hydrolase domain-containing protein [Thalassotalea eurytherma]|uniref:Cellobionic acid phosphorylase n=1 Tax=Thalassotalea eurytherma TaxID=1144278 RepID=A0ABQ6H4E2_9GAMM|nr:NdvB protein [Thalassotalea eurytherma]GLX82389.1 cellobionic acid phosphorylase [Thalassotalea eurytherma]